MPAMLHGVYIASLLGLPAEDWSALATWSAVIIGAGGGLIAFRQLRQTQELRFEQAQPYVVAYLAATPNEAVIFDLVVKNFGATAATDIAVQVTPPPLRAIDKDDPNNPGLIVPDLIPTLVPGQEWRTIWDSGIARYDSDLPSRYEATVSFADSRGKRHDYAYVIDWRTLYDTEHATSYGIHHAAKALREISTVMGKWTEGAAGRLSVVVRDGEARDRRERERRDARRAERSSQPPPDDPPGSTQPVDRDKP
jgi:hypothetical protein